MRPHNKDLGGDNYASRCHFACFARIKLERSLRED